MNALVLAMQSATQIMDELVAELADNPGRSLRTRYRRILRPYPDPRRMGTYSGDGSDSRKGSCCYRWAAKIVGAHGKPSVGR